MRPGGELLQRWRLAGAAVLAAAAFGLTGLTAALDRHLLDLACARLPVSDSSRPVVLVAIDEASLQTMGRWPWPRRRLAALLDALAPAAPAAVAIDILLADPDPDPRSDAELAASMKRLGRVVLAMAGTHEGPGTPTLEVLPTAELAGAAAALGHTNIEVDGDGRVRRLQRQAGLGTAYWPALASAAQAVAEGRALQPVPAATGSGDPLAWVAAEEVLLPWPGLWPQVSRLSFENALAAGTADLPHGAIIVVGVTAAGLGPMLRVAEGLRTRVVAGPELQAAAIAGLTADAAIRPLMPTPSLLVAAFLAAALVPVVRLPLRRSSVRAPLAFLSIVGVCLSLLALARLWWPPGPVLAAGFAVLAARIAQGWVRERLALRTFRLRCELALQSIGEVVITTDQDGRIVSANSATASVLGADPQDLKGSPLAQLLRPLGVTELPMPAAGRPAGFDLSIGHEGEPPRELRATLARLAGRHVEAGLVVTFRDVTAERRLVRDMAHRATHDPLTGLPNRALLDDRIDNSLSRARRAGQAVAIAFVDVDRFKVINDSFGHAGGDAVLRELARRLQAAVRESDTVGRIGGDEFVVVLDGLENELGALAPLERMAAMLAQPVDLGGQGLRLTVSIGVAVCPRDGDARAELLRYADLALYRAKQTGRDRIVFYAEDMNVEAQDRLWLERELTAALEHDLVFLHYQPRYALDRLQLAGFECLARWEDATRGLIPPGRFIPVAEETGLICPLGRKIVTQATTMLGEWRLRQPELLLSINLSVVQLKADEGFVPFVAHELREHGLEPGQLEFEVTESLFLDPSLPVVDRRLRDLVGLGVRLAIDDFGTGYSSLNYLHRLPFTAIKIDRSFVRDVASDARGRAIIEAIVGLGRSLDKRLVAEGVETEAQLGVIKELGCHEAQGYLLGRPQPATDVAPLLAA